jgi:acetyl-CoA C-acetyltransferase
MGFPTREGGWDFIGSMMSGMVSRQENLGALIADWSGLRGAEAFKVEAARGSGAAAVHLGVMALASEYMDAVIAMGVEKMTVTSMPETTAADADFEGDQGVSFVSLNTLIMQRYLYEYKWKHTDFARFSMNAMKMPYPTLMRACMIAFQKLSTKKPI